jgi:hypothetical protein
MGELPTTHPQMFTLRAEPLPLSGAGKVVKTVLRREMQL